MITKILFIYPNLLKGPLIAKDEENHTRAISLSVYYYSKQSETQRKIELISFN